MNNYVKKGSRKLVTYHSSGGKGPDRKKKSKIKWAPKTVTVHLTGKKHTWAEQLAQLEL